METNFFKNRVKFYLIAPIYIMSNRKDNKLITKASGEFHCRAPWARGPVAGFAIALDIINQNLKNNIGMEADTNFKEE